MPRRLRIIPAPPGPNPLFGAASGRFLGWWHADDLVWRDVRGDAVGYLEEGWGPLDDHGYYDDDGDDDGGGASDEDAELQQYSLYRFAPDRFGEVGVPHGGLLIGIPEFGHEWAGRYGFSWRGLGRRAVPPAAALARRAVPPCPAGREGRATGSLRDPEDCTYKG